MRVNVIEELVICQVEQILETRDKTADFLRKIYGYVRQIKILGSAATNITLLARGGVDIRSFSRQSYTS